jgi:hypothetical protein
MTLYVRLKIVLLSFMLLLTGITASRGEAFLCKKKAAIRATASVEAPTGLLLSDDIQLNSGSDNEIEVDSGSFWLFYEEGEIQLEIKIDGVRKNYFDLEESVVTNLKNSSKIKLIDPARLLENISEGKTVTVSIIYSEN